MEQSSEPLRARCQGCGRTMVVGPASKSVLDVDVYPRHQTRGPGMGPLCTGSGKAVVVGDYVLPPGRSSVTAVYR